MATSEYALAPAWEFAIAIFPSSVRPITHGFSSSFQSRSKSEFGVYAYSCAQIHGNALNVVRRISGFARRENLTVPAKR
jgi:hypothetical protein